jgi:hypothetical protein
VKIPPEKIKPVIKSEELKISGRIVDIEQYKRVAFKEATNQVLSRVKFIWSERWELGGGGILLGEYLIPELGQQALLVK